MITRLFSALVLKYNFIFFISKFAKKVEHISSLKSDIVIDDLIFSKLELLSTVVKFKKLSREFIIFLVLTMALFVNSILLSKFKCSCFSRVKYPNIEVIGVLIS